MRKNKKKFHIGHVLVYYSLAIGIWAIATHAIDANASWRCNQLADQAAEYDGFYITDVEKEMCESVNVPVNVRYPKDMVEERERSLENKEVEIVQIPEQEIPDWYLAQQYAKEKETAYLNLIGPLKEICACESTGNPNNVPEHYESDGVTVLTGRITPADIGMCQINRDYHEANAHSMGLDLNDPHDQVEYANWLYKNEGTQPWSASSACWGN